MTYWVVSTPKQTLASTSKAIDDVGNANNIIIRASDTDIAVIMLHHAWKFSATLWMDTGTTNGKTDDEYRFEDVPGPTRQPSFVLFQFFSDRDCPSSTKDSS